MVGFNVYRYEKTQQGSGIMDDLMKPFYFARYPGEIML